MSISQLQDHTNAQLNDTDADLLLRLRIALSVHRRAGWHLVRFTAENGVVQLTGAVPTFYDRQLIASLVRHVAGVFGIEDNLTVGDLSIRQQVVDAEKTPSRSRTATSAAPARDPFRHIPVLPQTSDEILVGPAVNVVHAS